MRIQWKSMPSSRKGKGKEKSGKGKKRGKKGKEIHSGKGYGETTTEHSRFPRWVSKLLKIRTPKLLGFPNLKVKARAVESRISKSKKSVKVTAVKQVEESWTLNTLHTAAKFISSEHDWMLRRETLDIFDGRQQETSVHRWIGKISLIGRLREHELMIDSGCFGHVCPPWCAPQFPMVSSTNVDAVAANNVALQHYGQNVVYGHVMTNSGRRLLDPDHIWRTLDVVNVRKTFLELFCTETSWRHNHNQSWLWPRHFSKSDSEFGISRLSFIFTHHSDEWNTSSQSDGDGWRECGKWRGWGSLRQRWSRETWGSRSFSWWSTSHRRCGSSWTAEYYWWNENCKNTTYSWTTDRCCENGTRNATHVQFRDWCPTYVASRGRSSPRMRCRNSRQTSYSFEQWERAEFSHVSHSWKRSVEQWSASCAFGNVVLRIWRRKSLDILKLTVSSIRSFFNATKRRVSLMRVEKLHANETWEQLYDFRQKQVIRATGLSKQYTDTQRDSHRW